MALCSFFFFFLMLSPNDLLCLCARRFLRRSSRAKPVAVKLSALEGCLLSELYLSHMHQKYNLLTQTPGLSLRSHWSLRWRGARKLLFSGVLSSVARRFLWTKQVILLWWCLKLSCVEPVCFSAHLLQLWCFDSWDLCDVLPTRNFFKEKKRFCNSGCWGQQPTPSCRYIRKILSSWVAANVSWCDFLTLFP